MSSIPDWIQDSFDEEIRDPYTSRITFNEHGLIYTPSILGTYFQNTCKIFIYAYIYDENEQLIEVIKPYYRLKMLNTLVHEIAHHDDLMRRTGRGRWLMLNEDKGEDYAEFKEVEWTKEIVVPYLLETYPEEYSRLTQWIMDNGGISIHLTKLVRPDDGKNHGKMIRLGTSINGAVENLFSNIAQGKSAVMIYLICRLMK